MKKVLPTLSIIFAGAFWGCLSLFLRPLSGYGLDGMQNALIKIFFATIALIIIVLIVNPKLFKFRLKDIWIFLGNGIISLGLFTFVYFQTLIHTDVSVAVVLLYTSPIFVLILSAIIFKEQITIKKIIAIIVTIIGCIFVTGLINGKAIITPMVLFTGLLSGLTFAFTSIFSKLAYEKDYNTLTINVWTFIFGLIFILPFVKIKETISIIGANPIVLLIGFGLSIFNAIIPFLLFTWGVKNTEPSKAGILVAVEPMVASIIGMCVFKESHDIFKILGVVFIIIAIVLMNIQTKNSTTSCK